MIETSILNGALFLDMVRGGAANLYSNISAVNDLNVFPIPDGDTGDNMYMTIRSGSSASDGSESLAKVSSDIAHGMLLGARGNSGVILSRIFAGIASGLSNKEYTDVQGFAEAALCGVRQAYDAVSNPVEGTMLTVYREAAEYAADNVNDSSSIVDSIRLLRDEAARSLERTPELLQILKEAGVVDSGGAGLVCIIDGMLDVLDGKSVAVPGADITSPSAPDLSLFTEDSVLEFGYCTEFLLRLQNCKTDLDKFSIDAFSAKMSEIGESVVAFRDGSIVKVHVHTMKPSEVLEYAQQFGEFLTVKIENMTLQHHEAEAGKQIKTRKPHKKYGIVAVAAGDGIRNTFESMGADVVINGGQCMNPSTADFLDAFKEINADKILVFPGNGNIILTATQAAELYDKAEVRVVPCKSIGEIYVALSTLDTSQNDTEALIGEITDILKDVVCGNVSKAVRDAEINGVRIACGEYIGYGGGKIMAHGEDTVKVTVDLAGKLHADDYGVMLLICGEGAADSEADSICAELTETYKRTEVIMINGGQPIQDYILVLE